MNRQSALLAGLGVVLLIVLFYFFAFKPKNDELAEIQAQTDEVIVQQAALEARIAELEAVRAEAPSIESVLAAAESVIPRESALPSALRQLQLAADDSGVELLSISPGRPAAGVDPAVPSAISIALTLEGGYFQVVDFLRRVEDPAIVPRAILFESLSVTPAEYPTLAVSLSGEMYAVLPVLAPEPATEPTPPPPGTEPPAGTEPPVAPAEPQEPAA